MEPEFVSHEEMFEIIIQDCEDTIQLIINEIKELRESRQEIQVMYNAKKVSEFGRDIELEQCHRVMEKAKGSLKDAYWQKQLAQRELKRIKG